MRGSRLTAGQNVRGRRHRVGAEGLEHARPILTKWWRASSSVTARPCAVNNGEGDPLRRRQEARGLSAIRGLRPGVVSWRSANVSDPDRTGKTLPVPDRCVALRPGCLVRGSTERTNSGATGANPCASGVLVKPHASRLVTPSVPQLRARRARVRPRPSPTQRCRRRVRPGGPICTPHLRAGQMSLAMRPTRQRAGGPCSSWRVWPLSTRSTCGPSRTTGRPGCWHRWANPRW